MSALARHARILRHYARVGLVRKSQFRTEFLVQVIMDCFWYTSHVLVFEFLYAHTESIAGWERAEVRVFLGYMFVADAFMMTWLGKGWTFGKDLKDGNLDPVRLRPASPIVLYFFQLFSVEGLTNMSIALAYLLYACHSAGLELGLETALLFGWGILLAWWGRTVLSVGFSILEFWVLHSDLSQFFSELVMAPSNQPLDVFGARLKGFFLYAVPAGAMAFLPASIALSRMSPLAGLLHTSWVVLLGLGAFRFWRYSFRRYESALS